MLISADGRIHDPLAILPRKTHPRSLDIDARVLQMCFAHSESGWMTRALFELWTEHILIPQATAARDSPNDRILLLLDGHSSRASVRAIEMMQSHGIDTHVIPAHSSHITQPLDLCVFEIELSALRELDSLPDLLLGCRSALHKATTPINIGAAFKRAGVWPFNREEVQKHPAIVKEQPAAESEQPATEEQTPKRLSMGEGSSHPLSFSIKSGQPETEPSSEDSQHPMSVILGTSQVHPSMREFKRST